MKYIILLKANADEEEREEEMGASDRKFTEANEKKVEVGHVIIVPNTETKVNVTAVGKDGVTAQDEEGNKYLVRHENVVTEDEQSEEEGSNEIEKEQREKIKISLDDMLNKKEHKKGTSLDTSKPQKKDDEEAEKKEKGEEKESSFKDEDSEDEDEDSDESKKKGEKKELPFKKKDKENDVGEKKESSSKKKDSKVEEVDESKKGDESSFKEASEKEKSKDEKKETKEDETTVEGYLNKNYTQNAWINPSDIAKLMDIERSEVDKQLMELSERGIVQLQAEQKTGEKLYKYVKAERAKEEAKANSYSKDPFDKKKVNPKHKKDDEGETKEVDLKKLVPSELWKKEDEDD